MSKPSPSTATGAYGPLGPNEAVVGIANSVSTVYVQCIVVMFYTITRSGKSWKRKLVNLPCTMPYCTELKLWRATTISLRYVHYFLLLLIFELH